MLWGIELKIDCRMSLISGWWTFSVRRIDRLASSTCTDRLSGVFGFEEPRLKGVLSPAVMFKPLRQSSPGASEPVLPASRPRQASNGSWDAATPGIVRDW